MKHSILLPSIFTLAFILPACSKNNNPNPATKDSTAGGAFPTDSATGIVIVTEANVSGYKATSLLFFNSDATLRWRKDPINGEIYTGTAYADGTLFVSAGYAREIGTTGNYYQYGKIYAYDPANGSLKWTYTDSLIVSEMVAGGSEIYVQRAGVILGFDTVVLQTKVDRLQDSD